MLEREINQKYSEGEQLILLQNTNKQKTRSITVVLLELLGVQLPVHIDNN